MDAFVQSFLLSVLPSGSQIIETQSYRPDYLRYPIRVSVRTQQGDLQHCVVKKGNKRDLIEHEARVLRALTEWGIPVPTVLGELTELSEETGNGALMVLSELPGRPLPWLGITSLAEAELTCHLLIDGVTRLHRLTEQVRKHDIAATLPQCTLASEFEDVVQSAGDWFQQDLFARAIEQLNDVLTHITTQPVFSNGDYNPLNFLYDGEALTGFVDFEGACLGTFAPARLASDKPMAMACFRLFTVLPLPPDLSAPRFISCIARSTLRDASFFDFERAGALRWAAMAEPLRAGCVVGGGGVVAGAHRVEPLQERVEAVFSEIFAEVGT